MYFLQTSAKSCDNVDRLFTEIAHELLQQVFIFGQYCAFNIRYQIFGRNLNWKCLQAKTKDLPSESHSVQNISDPIGQNTSQVKQNCCSKVFWALRFQASRKFVEPQDILDFSELSRLPNAQKFVGDHQPPSHMQRKCTFWKSSSKDKPPIRMNPNDTSSF